MSTSRGTCRGLVATTLAWGWLASSAVAAPPSAAPAPVPIGRALPDLAMTGLNGPQRSLSSFRGRPLVINVWASWCSPCRKEAASLERLAWSEAARGFAIIGISTDDDRASALLWLKQSNATLSHFIDAGPQWPLENTLGASSIPLTVLVDARGRVVARFQGAREWDTPESIRMIERAFAGAGGTGAGR